MKIDIRGLIPQVGSELKFALRAEDNFRILDYGEYSFSQPVTGKFIISTESQGILRFRGQAELTWQASCQRCLSELEELLSIEINERIFPHSYQLELADSILAEQITPSDLAASVDEFYFHNGLYLEIEKIITDQLFLALPLQILCEEDCAGLCAHCGALQKDCTCDQESAQETRAVHPAFDKLRELL